MLIGKPPGLVVTSSVPYLTRFFAYAVEEVQTRANERAIATVTRIFMSEVTMSFF
jgi:hypothetical protein